MTAQKLSITILGLLLGSTLVLLWACGAKENASSIVNWSGIVAFGLLLVVVAVADRGDSIKPLVDSYARKTSDAETAKANAEAEKTAAENAKATAEADLLAAENAKATAVVERDTAIAERDLARRDRGAAADLAARLAPQAEALQRSLIVGAHITADKTMHQVAIDLGALADAAKANILNELLSQLDSSYAAIKLEDLEK